MSTSLSISHGSFSTAGIKPQNEDYCDLQIPDDILLTSKGIAAAIADGMSGSDAGKEASHSCVSGFLRDYYSTPESWTTKTSVSKVLSSLNSWLYGQGQKQYGSHRGMVTTLSAVVFKSTTAYLFHIGDTRIYLLRDKQLKQLTKDHRYEISAEKNYLTRAMGIDVHIDIDYKEVPLESGDLFIMTTDGVHEFINDKKLQQLCSSDSSLDQCAQNIVDAASQNNSDDNLSCQLLKINSLPSENEHEFYRKLTELPFPPPLEPGMTLDGYKVIRQLFSNKRTEVYLTYDHNSKEHVVLKAPSLNYSDNAEYINQFLHEEWAGRRIKSNHVLKIYEPNRKRTALYYLAEFIKGQTLREWMQDNPKPPLATVRQIISQIAHGLRAFHRLEMIHQDLKPENIMIDADGTIKIIDFGSTKIPGIEEIYTPIDHQNILGTENYTAPEYLNNQPGSNRSDIYSLGVICYEMLTGKLPYGKTLNKKHLGKAQYHPSVFIRSDIPPWFDKTIEKAVHINPQKRFELLSEFTYSLNTPDSNLISRETVPLLKSNPLGFWKTLSLLLLLCNLILIYLLLNNR